MMVVMNEQKNKISAYKSSWPAFFISTVNDLYKYQFTFCFLFFLISPPKKITAFFKKEAIPKWIHTIIQFPFRDLVFKIISVWNGGPFFMKTTVTNKFTSSKFLSSIYNIKTMCINILIIQLYDSKSFFVTIETNSYTQ